MQHDAINDLELWEAVSGSFDLSCVQLALIDPFELRRVYDDIISGKLQ
jgi:hypothetical protein